MNPQSRSRSTVATTFFVIAAYFVCMNSEFRVLVLYQSELPRPIPRNSMESDQGCTSRIYFDNVGDNVTLTLYNVMLATQKPC